MKKRLLFVSFMLVWMAFTIGYRYGVDIGLDAVSARYEARLAYIEERFPRMEGQVQANTDGLTVVVHSLAVAHNNISNYAGTVDDLRSFVVKANYKRR